MSSMRRDRGYVSHGLLVLALVVMLAPAALATDPPRKLTAWNWYGAPGCDSIDGEVIFTNSSHVFHYRVMVTADFSVPGLACGVSGCPIPKVDCMCGVLGATLIIAPDAQNSLRCLLPDCQDTCEIHCQNTNPTCSPASHCTESETPTSFTYLHWSRDGTTWTEFEDIYTVYVTAYEESAFCP